ncbi:alkaline phosphatase family protein [Bradyrhizobium sp. McL0615]|uniref:alkaline phosphatase family protein n=1 Tax=Bradyrhizobium sp. McL0615 TaxID=3415673 RepID=UPI003CEE776D
MEPVTLYEGVNFAGQPVGIGEGSTRFPTAPQFNDRASSVRVAPGYAAVLYEHANEFGGYGLSVDLLEDCPDLTVYGFDKMVSYIRVFRTERQGSFVYVRGSMSSGTYVAGHWERKRADGSLVPAVGAVAVVGPSLPPPTVLESHTDSIEIRVHTGGGGGGGGVSVTGTVEHLFVLMLENRSFDHMLGLSGITGPDAQTGAQTAIDGLSGTESNSYNGRTFTVSRGAPDVALHDPGHGFTSVLIQLCGEGARYESGNTYPAINNSGFVFDYARQHPDTPDEAMKCFTPEQVPVITALAREFVVCDRWFCSMPGPTEPNRWFVHAGTAGNRDDNLSKREYADGMALPWGGVEFENGSIFSHLKKAGVKYRIYACDEFPNVALLDGVSRTFDIDDFDDFAEDVASASYDAAYTFIEPSYDVFRKYKGGNSQHPLASAKAGELLIMRTYEALRKSPIWASSMLVVTYDEHGGFYDHVAPPPARATGSKGRASGFMFDQLGPRVPAVIVSPLIPKNLIDHRVYEHSSVIATLINLFNLEPLTPRTSSSSNFRHLVSLSVPRDDAPLTLPDPMAGMMTRSIKLTVADTVADKPNAPLEDDPTGMIDEVVQSGLVQHIEVTPPSEHPAIRERVKSLRTHGDALEYLKEVADLVKLARQKAGVRRSPTVRRALG